MEDNFKTRYLAGEVEFEEIDDYSYEWGMSGRGCMDQRRGRGAQGSIGQSEKSRQIGAVRALTAGLKKVLSYPQSAACLHW